MLKMYLCVECGMQKTFKRLNNELIMNSLNTFKNNCCYSILWKLRDFLVIQELVVTNPANM